MFSGYILILPISNIVDHQLTLTDTFRDFNLGIYSQEIIAKNKSNFSSYIGKEVSLFSLPCPSHNLLFSILAEFIRQVQLLLEIKI